MIRQSVFSSPTSSIGKNESQVQNFRLISFFVKGSALMWIRSKRQAYCEQRQTSSDNSHPHLPIFNEDPSKLLTLYAATSSMSLCHIENPYLKFLGAFVYDPGFQVTTRRALAGMIIRQCEVTMKDIRERVR
uniref:Uncharacterized protein n=1 Tax=Ditylenchus dipsaci TaxID=166011 RepID=A0A915CZW7_9BILA